MNDHISASTRKYENENNRAEEGFYFILFLFKVDNIKKMNNDTGLKQ